MVFEHIEKLKREYTDKYVVVEDGRPELRRFKGQTGTVRTVNMSGRALVEFDAYDNIGWYDIDVDFLKVIDEPLPKQDAKPAKTEAKAKPTAKAKPAAKAAKPAAATSAKEMSVSDVLAAARTKGESDASPAKDPKKMSIEDVLAAARGDKKETSPVQTTKQQSAAPSPAKLDPSKMSVEEMLAAARANKGGAPAPAAGPAANDETEKKKEDLTAQLQAARVPATSTVASPPKSAPAKLDPKKMSVEEMLAAARAETTGGAPAEAVDPVAEESEAAEAPAEEPPVTAAEPEPPAAPSGPLPTDTAEIVEYCRKVDAR